jgi:hypothetical protein
MYERAVTKRRGGIEDAPDDTDGRGRPVRIALAGERLLEDAARA